MTEETKEAKRLFIEAYFDRLEQRIEVAQQLFDNRMADEALLICCCYIEAIGSNLYWPDEGAAYNFSRALREHGNEPFLWHVHPKQLVEGLSRAKAKATKLLAHKLADFRADDDHDLRTPDAAVDEVAARLSPAELRLLRDNLWRGTVSHLAYERLRCPAVHGLGATEQWFSGSRLDGVPVPILGFETLIGPLRRICAAARRASMDGAIWFSVAFDAATRETN